MLNKLDLKITDIASKDDSRPVLTGVKVSKHTEGGKNFIRLAVTDGYRLTEKTIAVDAPVEFDHKIIPASRLKKVAAMMSAKDTLDITDDQFIITDKDGVIIWQLAIGETIDGNYPDYAQLVPKKDEQCITLNVRYMQELLDQHQGNTGSFQLQVAVHDGKVQRLSPVRIDNSDENTTTVSVLMPLKS